MMTSKFARLHISIAALLFVHALPSASQIFKAPGVFYGSGGFLTRSVAVADLNGDGKLDLVVTNCGPAAIPGCGVGTVGVLLGNGDGTFQPAITYGSGGQAWSVAVADVNRDGKPDLIVANYASSTVGVLLGKGDGTFQPAVTYDSGGSYSVSVTVADVNGDGKPDLVVSNSLAPSPGGGAVGQW